MDAAPSPPDLPELEPTLVGPAPAPPSPAWPSDFELEVRSRLASLEAHLARSDGLITAVQLELRGTLRKLDGHIDGQFHELKRSIEGVVHLLKQVAGNGHG